MKRHYLDFVAMSIPGQLGHEFFRLLGEHPELCLLDTQTHYFSSENVKKGRDWYEGHFSACKPGQKRGEFSTSYLHAPGAGARLAREYPDAKLFALLPDPLEAVATMYFEAKKEHQGRLAPQTLEEFIERHPKLLEQFRFGRQLAAFFGYYSPVDFEVHTFEDVRSTPAKIITSAYELLKVDTKFIPKQLLSTVKTDEDLERPSRLSRLLRLDRIKAKRRLKEQVLAKTFFTAPVITMTAREQVLLTRYYEDDVAQLSALLHRNMAAEWHHVHVEKKWQQKSSKQIR